MTKSDLLTPLLVLWSLNLAANEVYYIITTLHAWAMSDSLPVCYELKPSPLSQHNTCLPSWKALYLNNTVLTISNLDFFAMLSENSTAHITCENYSSIYFNHSHYTEIINLEFIGCGGNKVIRVVEFFVQDAKFKGQEYSGTALELIETMA